MNISEGKHMKIIEITLIVLLVIGIAMLPGCTDKSEEDEETDEENGVVENELPTGSMWLPEHVYVGETAVFDGSNSTDPDGEIVGYYWDFGDGTKATGKVVDHVYVREAYLQVVLEVEDDKGAKDTDHIFLQIEEREENTTEMEPPSIGLTCRKIGVIPDMAKYIVTVSNVSGNNTGIEHFEYVILDHEDASILDNNTVANSWNNVSSGVVFTSLDPYLNDEDRFTISAEDIPGLDDGDLFQIIFTPLELLIAECILMDEQIR